MDLEIKKVGEMACKAALAAGGHMPIILARGTHTGTIIGFGDFPDNFEGKSRAMLGAGIELAKNKEKMGDLLNVYFISEAWTSIVSKKEGEKSMKTGKWKKPSLDAKRIETLLVTGRNVASNKNAVLAYKMVRDKEGKLIDLKEESRFQQAEEVKSPLLDAFVFGYGKGESKKAAPPATA